MADLAGVPAGDPLAELHAKHRRSPQPESKQVTAVLEAIAEILRQEGIPPSPTAVFAAGPDVASPFRLNRGSCGGC